MIRFVSFEATAFTSDHISVVTTLLDSSGEVLSSSMITVVSATSIKIACTVISTWGTVISRSIVSKFVTGLQQAVIYRSLEPHHLGKKKYNTRMLILR